jgi:hypothetical protein
LRSTKECLPSRLMPPLARGCKRHAKTDKTDCRHHGTLLAEDGCLSAGSRPATFRNAGRYL